MHLIITDNNVEVLFLLNGVSLMFLIVFNCSSSLSGRGILIDVEESDKKCVTLPIQFFQIDIKSVPDEKVCNQKSKNNVSNSTKL